MIIHKFQKKQIVRTNLEQAWDFFSNPYNLQKITPKSMNFEITSAVPEKIYPGLIITYKVRPISFMKVNWVTEITQAKENSYFIDEQRFGPYKFWYHIHLFHQIQDGVEMEDIVYYGLPFGFIGNIFGSKFVKNRLNQIFDYREKQISLIFQKTN